MAGGVEFLPETDALRLSALKSAQAKVILSGKTKISGPKRPSPLLGIVELPSLVSCESKRDQHRYRSKNWTDAGYA